jgi:hypothetical protein
MTEFSAVIVVGVGVSASVFGAADGRTATDVAGALFADATDEWLSFLVRRTIAVATTITTPIPTPSTVFWVRFKSGDFGATGGATGGGATAGGATAGGATAGGATAGGATAGGATAGGATAGGATGGGGISGSVGTAMTVRSAAGVTCLLGASDVSGSRSPTAGNGSATAPIGVPQFTQNLVSTRRRCPQLTQNFVAEGSLIWSTSIFAA